MERTIIITYYAGNASKENCKATYDNFKGRCWGKTRCLFTTDCSWDDKINLEGLLWYQVPPSLKHLPVTGTIPVPHSEKKCANNEKFKRRDGRQFTRGERRWMHRWGWSNWFCVVLWEKPSWITSSYVNTM